MLHIIVYMIYIETDSNKLNNLGWALLAVLLTLILFNLVCMLAILCYTVY